MLIPNQEIEITWVAGNRNRLESLGLDFTGYSTTVKISPEQLTFGVEKLIKVKCDVCDGIYSRYHKDHFSSKQKSPEKSDICVECRKAKKVTIKKIINKDYKYKISHNIYEKIIPKLGMYQFQDVLSIEDVSLVPKNKSGIYIFFNQNLDVMYIGKSKDIKSRLYNHMNGLTHTKEFKNEFKYASILYLNNYKDDSYSMEKDIIKNLEPKYNIIFNSL